MSLVCMGEPGRTLVYINDNFCWLKVFLFLMLAG